MKTFVFAICAMLAVADFEIEDVAEIKAFAIDMHGTICEQPRDSVVRVEARAALAEEPTVIAFLEKVGLSPYCKI